MSNTPNWDEAPQGFDYWIVGIDGTAEFYRLHDDKYKDLDDSFFLHYDERINVIKRPEPIDTVLDKENLELLVDYTARPKQERYTEGNGKDLIDRWAEVRTPEEFRTIMWAMMEKYECRLGKKDSIAQEVGKIADYANRWHEYEKQLAAKNNES